MDLTDPRIAVITGFSGAGKSTIAQHLVANHGNQIVRAITHTTRPPREGEVQGQDYHFLDLPTFQEMEKAGNFLETNEYAGNFYATPHFKRLDLGEGQIPLYVVDMNGALFFKKNHPSIEAFFIYVSPEEQRRRLIYERGGEDAKLEARLAHYETEHKVLDQHKDSFHILRNEEPEDFDKVVQHFRSTLQLG